MNDETLMDEALAAAASVQGLTAPNPWVGCVVVTADGRRGDYKRARCALHRRHEARHVLYAAECRLRPKLLPLRCLLLPPQEDPDARARSNECAGSFAAGAACGSNHKLHYCSP